MLNHRSLYNTNSSSYSSTKMLVDFNNFLIAITA